MMRILSFCLLVLCITTDALAQPMLPKNTASIFRCQTAEELEQHNNEIRRLKASYYVEHKDSTFTHRVQAGHLLLGWPLRANSNYDFNYSYYNTQNYVDQTSLSITFQDYNCGSRTYEGHDASDINLYPFWWRMMDKDYVMAVAAAPGIILQKNDGNFDRNCTKVGSPNMIVVLHDDGTTTRYLHLKENSLTSKAVNERVEQGEFLGFIGSSGRSSNPHLHFAVYDSNDVLVEPYFNANSSSCNNRSIDTWWQTQKDYWEPQIIRLMTHSNVPSLEFCPDDETVYAKNQFSSGELIYTGIAFMDAQDGDVANCSLVQPNGTTFSTWNVNIDQTYSRMYKTSLGLLPSGNTGTWTFKAVYRSKTYVHFFTVGCKATETVSGSISGNDGYIAGTNISSTAVHTGSSAKVLYQAADYIELKPGFRASAGVHFKARIKPCTYVE